MGLFDGDGSNFWSDPNNMALLGMAAGFGDAAMPSRMPVPLGAAFGSAARGAMGGAQQAFNARKEAMQSQLFAAQVAQAQQQMGMANKLYPYFDQILKGLGVAPPNQTPPAAAASPTAAGPTDTYTPPAGAPPSPTMRQAVFGSLAPQLDPSSGLAVNPSAPGNSATPGFNPHGAGFPDIPGGWPFPNTLAANQQPAPGRLPMVANYPQLTPEEIQAIQGPGAPPHARLAANVSPSPVGSTVPFGVPQQPVPQMQPQAAPQAPAPMSLAPGLPAGLDPQRLAALSGMAELARLPNAFKPLMDYYYNTPEYLAQAAYAKGGGQSPWDMMLKNLEANNALRNELGKMGMQLVNGQIVPIGGYNAANAATKGSEAGAVSAAQAPYKFESGRPGTITYDALGRPRFAVPIHVPSVDPLTGNETLSWQAPPMTPGAQPTLPNPPNAARPAMAPPPNAGPQALPGAPPAPAAPAAPPPNAAAPAGAPPIVTKIGPGVHEALTAQAKAEQESRQKTIDAGAAAQSQQATLQLMQADAPNFYTGVWADHLQDARRLWVGLGFASDRLTQATASYEDFVKNAGALTRQAVRETSPRAAVQEFRLINSALPNPEMTPQGLQRVLNEYMGLNDYHIVKSQAQQAWEQSHGGPGRVTGFETDWQGKVSPYAFIIARMAPADRQALFAQVGRTAVGQAELQHLTQQINYIQSSGLAQFIR